MAKLYIEDNEVRPAILVLEDSEPNPSGFTESNNISDWDFYAPRKVGVIALPDFISLKLKIGELVTAKGFSNCSADEKIIASKWFVIDKTDRDSVRTEEEQRLDAKNLIFNIRTDNSSLCVFTTDVDTKLAKINVSNNGNIVAEIL